MMFGSALFDSTQVKLEINTTAQAQVWHSSQGYATQMSQWNAFINQLCLQVVLPWLREDRTAIPYPNQRALASIWEVVNGTVILLSNRNSDTGAQRKIVVIPTEAIDQDEFLVPQEWVDIPEWAGDYYLAAAVDPDEGWLQIKGFATHRQLKQEGDYLPDDRAYSLDESLLNTDMSTFWVVQTLESVELTRAEIKPLPRLAPVQAQNLIQRLGSAEILEPRFAVPFETWAALIAHDGWRQQLAEQRRGITTPRSLRHWVQAGITDLAEWGWQQVNYQIRLGEARGSEATEGTTALIRQIQVAGDTYVLQVIPVDMDANVWRFALRSQTPGALIPPGFVLRLLTEDLQPFENNQATTAVPVEQLYLEAALELGEGIVWEVEPTPAEYEREILRF